MQYGNAKINAKEEGMTRKLMLLAGVLILLGSQSLAAQKGQKISVRDDPSMKEGNPGLVLVEVSDFQ